MNPAQAYLNEASRVLERICSSQMDALEEAANICTQSIAGGGLVHLFGSGHSRMGVEEVFPRYGSFPGFHPIVELSLTYHNQVVGANGQRQAIFLERVEGLGKTILRNFILEPPDSFIVFSNSGVNEVVVEVALEAKARNLPLIAIVSEAHCNASDTRHSSGKWLTDLADVILDNCVPAGDAMVHIDGHPDPIGPGSTVGVALLVNSLKCLVAQKLTDRGMPPIVLTSSYHIGSEASAARFDECFDDYRARVRRVYGATEGQSAASSP